MWTILAATVTTRPEGNVAEGFPDRGFKAYWSAIGVSQFGTAVSMVTIPMVAVLTIGATPGQMTWLVVMELAPAMLAGVPAAAWADTLHRRLPPLIGCNVVQALVVGAIPLLWWLGSLNYPALLALVGVSSLVRGLQSALSSPILVQIVPREHLVDANGKTNATRSVADIGGPAAGGMLMAVLAAPLVVLADALSFLLSAALLTRVRTPPPSGRAPRERSRGTLGEVVRLARALGRRSGVQALATLCVAQGIMQPILVLFLVRELGLGPAPIGLLLGLGAVGGVGGGLLLGRVIGRHGPGRTLALGTAVSMCSLLALPFSAPGVSGAAAVVLFELAGSLGGTVMAATVYGTLQSAAKDGEVAKVMALAGTFLQVGGLVGSFAGGALATAFGLRAAAGTAAALMPLLLLPQLVRWYTARWRIDTATIG
ncbi:MFS transporter [Streptosporangium sp. NPDC020072]|uniref:MFS transporter n=1 Tax=Streptosporangium sp. NPDC020072 TaxID=3154788 RepID=UPI003435BC4F